MDVIIITRLKTSAPDVSTVADAIYKAIDTVVDNANLLAKTKDKKINTILSFEASEIRPGSIIKKEFTFPNDLDQVKSQK